jgi:hypothetical protein
MPHTRSLTRYGFTFVEPVSGFEPLTVRLQGGCSAKLSYTGRLVPSFRTRNPCQRTGSGVPQLTGCGCLERVDAEHLGARSLAWTLEKRPRPPAHDGRELCHGHSARVGPRDPWPARRRPVEGPVFLPGHAVTAPSAQAPPAHAHGEPGCPSCGIRRRDHLPEISPYLRHNTWSRQRSWKISVYIARFSSTKKKVSTIMAQARLPGVVRRHASEPANHAPPEPGANKPRAAPKSRPARADEHAAPARSPQTGHITSHKPQNIQKPRPAGPRSSGQAAQPAKRPTGQSANRSAPASGRQRDQAAPAPVRPLSQAARWAAAARCPAPRATGRAGRRTTAGPPAVPASA